MELRIKALRKALGLTQQEFADKIGSVQNTITGYETGRRTPSNQVIALICEKFNVNEKWLRTGEGEMFVQHSRDEEIARFFGEVLKDERDDFRRRLIHALSKLTADEWAMIERWCEQYSILLKKRQYVFFTIFSVSPLFNNILHFMVNFFLIILSNYKN